MATKPANTTAATSFVPAKDTQEKLVQYVKNTLDFLNNNWNLRTQLLDRDLSYYREQDRTKNQARAQAANRAGNTDALQNVTIPVVMPQTESALSYLVNIFLNSYPIFPVISKPAVIAEALQMETVIGETSVRFGWPRELLLTLRDGLKYNLGIAEVCWKTKRIFSVTNDASYDVDLGKPEETYYQGNYIKRIDPYNAILDTRVHPARMHTDGEFAGYTELLSRISLKQLLLDLGTGAMNAKLALETAEAQITTNTSSSAFYVPQVNPQALLDPAFTTTNWLAWAGLDTEHKIKYNNMYEVTTLYCRIMPGEFGIFGKAPNHPQIYKLIVVNRQFLIFCERQTNAHNYLPMLVSQPTEDGLGWQTKSFSENVDGIQKASSALYNSAIASQRRKVYDRIFYDPSRVRKEDINNADPIARIPVRSSGYGGNVGEGIYAFPYRDEGITAVLQMSRDIADMGDVINGQNRVQRGQFQKGNKTRHEFQDVMQHSNARMQMMALLLEYQFFQPMKEIIKLNILQYQPKTTLYNRNKKESVTINPVELREKSVEFKMADGLLPVDKLINTEVLNMIMQLAQGVPQFGADYDLMGIFLYYMQLEGANWVEDFKRTPDGRAQWMLESVAMNKPEALAPQQPPATPTGA